MTACAGVAGGLAAAGIGVGDTVTVIAPNTPELFELHFAAPMSGAVLSTVNTRLEAETIGYIIEHSDSRLVIVARALRPLLDAALSTLEAPPPVMEIVRPDDQGGDAAPASDQTYDALLAAAPLEGRRPTGG